MKNESMEREFLSYQVLGLNYKFLLNPLDLREANKSIFET